MWLPKSYLFNLPLGTSLILYGTISPTDENEPPVSSYSIDNKTASIYPAPATNSTLYQQILFETYGLTAGEHSLTVTIKSTQPGDYWLDYAVVGFVALLSVGHHLIARSIPDMH